MSRNTRSKPRRHYQQIFLQTRRLSKNGVRFVLLSTIKKDVHGTLYGHKQELFIKSVLYRYIDFIIKSERQIKNCVNDVYFTVESLSVVHNTCEDLIIPITMDLRRSFEFNSFCNLLLIYEVLRRPR